MSSQLAAIYSQPLVALLAEGRALVDRIAVCPWHTEAQIREAQSYRPLMLHSMPAPFALNQLDPFSEAVMAQAQELLVLTDPPWLSVDFGPSVEAFECNGKIIPLSEPQPRSQVYLKTCRNAARLKQWLPVPLILGNLGYHPNGAYEHVCEPSFIIAVLDTVDCGFLLDIAHARISAHNLGLDERQYLRSLPLYRMREVHVSGPRLHNGAMTDAHGPLQDEDWEAVTFILARSKPEVVTLEYAKDKDQLQDQLQQLRDML
jgi:uncharacterized protein (UPF0276 family)